MRFLAFFAPQPPYAMEQAMKRRFRPRISRALNRPDLIYAGILAMVICVALIARSIGFLQP